MAVTPDPVHGVFIEVVGNALRTCIRSAVGVGVDPGWCLATIDDIIKNIRQEVESETAAGGASPRAIR